MKTYQVWVQRAFTEVVFVEAKNEMDAEDIALEMMINNEICFDNALVNEDVVEVIEQ